MSFENTLNRHNECEVVIIKRMIKNQLHPRAGLYCSNHCCLIKWLSDESYNELTSLGVEELDMLPDEQNQYDRRLKLMQTISHPPSRIKQLLEGLDPNKD